MKELFLPVKSYEGLYEISNFGRVMSLPKQWQAKEGNIHKRDKRELGYRKDKRGYTSTLLSKNGKKKTVLIHNLVWDHFGNQPRNGRKLQVDHKDENKSNPHIDNLQLLTNRQNISKSKSFNKKNGLPVGVSYRNDTGKYQAHITINYKHISLGCFISSELAASAYQKKVLQLEASDV